MRAYLHVLLLLLLAQRKELFLKVTKVYR